MPEHKAACTHLSEHPDLEVLFVIDAHLQIADAFLRCRACDAHYLVELVDILGQDYAYRLARVPAEHVHAAVRSLTRGSCDLNRARNEVFSVSSAAQPISGLLLAQGGTFTRLIETGPAVRIPTASWRSLPCDGALLRAATSEAM